MCLVFLWFCLCFQFLPDFSLFLWVLLDYFCCRLWHMLRVFCYCFLGFLNSLWGIFSANFNPLFISVVGYPLWCRIVCSSLRHVFLGFYWWLLCVFYMLVCKGGILYSFWGGGFWSGGIVGCLLVCGKISVMILPFTFFYKDV